MIIILLYQTAAGRRVSLKPKRKKNPKKTTNFTSFFCALSFSLFLLMYNDIIILCALSTLEMSVIEPLSMAFAICWTWWVEVYCILVRFWGDYPLQTSLCILDEPINLLRWDDDTVKLKKNYFSRHLGFLKNLFPQNWRFIYIMQKED
jgi:hypothetical protein